MKKLLAAGALLLALAGCSNSGDTTAVEMKESVTISLTTTTPDMSEYTFLEDDEPAFIEVSVTEAIKIFEEGQNAILYFGRTNCPWCQRAVPELNTVAKEYGYYVYYIDVDMSKLTLTDYYAIEPYITDSFEDGEFMIPDVIAVKDGVYADSHVSLIDGFVISSDSAQMSDSEKEELRDTYRDLFEDAGLSAE